jgi:cytochrome c-type biogenesis protein CcsB
MEKITKYIFSMKMMSLGLLIFLVAIGLATFIESIHGVQAAKIMVYNANWFTILLVYLSLNLIANIFAHRMWRKEKIAMFSFHLAFIIIMLGAAVTRYTGYEGVMVIREGKESNFIHTAEPKLLVSTTNQSDVQIAAFPAFLADWDWVNNDFSHTIGVGVNEVEVSYVDFQSAVVDTVVFNRKYSSSVLDIVVGQMQSNYVGEGEIFMAGTLPIAYQKPMNSPGVLIKSTKGQHLIKCDVPLRYLPMTRMAEARRTGAPIPDTAYQMVPMNRWVELKTKTLYQSGNNQFVLKNIFANAKKTFVKAKIKSMGADYLTVKVTSGKDSKVVRLQGGMNVLPVPEFLTVNGVQLQLEYGAIRKPIPFSVACRDFILAKYPGSESPSSFESYLTIIDNKNHYKSNRHIFMNHVTDYNGYRFFQSAYELDNPATPENEEATKLSVNHDSWGTNLTYLGYLLMAIGMLLSLFAPKGRFRELNSKINKLKTLSLPMLFLLLGNPLYGNNNPPDYSKIHREINAEHSELFARVLVQDDRGRIIPFHTLADQLLRKTYGTNSYKGLDAVQVVLGMHMYSKYWENQPMISVPKAVRERLKLKKYCSFRDLLDVHNNYKFLELYQKTHKKAEKEQDEFEKKLIKLTERFEVFQGILSWQYMKIVPKKDDPGNKWYVPLSMEIMGADSISSIVTLKYLTAIDQAAQSGNYKDANQLLPKIKEIQRKIGSKVVPSEKKVSFEISYNKMMIFKKVFNGYILIGLMLMLIYLLSVFWSPTAKFQKVLKIVRKGLLILTAGFFVYHGIGLGFRWYISGHAPWSNGYEAILFIAWVTVLAGWVFIRKIEVVMSGALILAAMMLFVSELNLLDPEITPLVPVLKSYWLMIHVAIITGSYGFLGLSFILGLLNLVLYLFRSQKNGARLSSQIAQITHTSEMTMTVGTFMLTIGTFLGGVWANESWGRYWGWDPKETWALVSILVYAIILHFRFIPKLKGMFAFNIASFWGYSAILFTYFGVNFMLVGLHSYAQGDGLASFPKWLIYTIVVFFVLSILAGIRNWRYTKAN